MDGDHPAGGSRVLAELIDKYGEVLIPDLLSEYGVDLRDLFRPSWPLSPRYVLSLVLALPMGSAFTAERRGGQQFRGWDETRYALVCAVHELQAIGHMYVLAHIDQEKTAKPKTPTPFPTPDTSEDRQATRPKPGSFAGIAASMLAAKRRKAAS